MGGTAVDPRRTGGEERGRRGMLAVQVGLGANVLLALLKAGMGIAANSPALLADGINSTSDVAYGVVMSVFMRISARPADREHPYGHEQMESIAAVVVGAFVITTAIAIFWNTVGRVWELLRGVGDFGGAALPALYAALFTVAFKTALAVWTGRIGERTRNSAVIALARDHRNDVFASLAAAVGIYFGRMGTPWVDPLAGAVVSLVILHTGVGILRESSANLMDTVPGRELASEIRGLLRGVEGIRSVEEVHAHRFGPYLVVNLCIGVDGDLSVSEGHRIAQAAEKTLLEGVEFMRRVYVHYQPVDG